jgi:hypothetical protein
MATAFLWIERKKYRNIEEKENAPYPNKTKINTPILEFKYRDR